MDWQLSENIEIADLEGSVALYDTFRNDTHFVGPPFNQLLMQLSNTPCNDAFLLNYLRQCCPDTETSDLQTQLTGFLTKADKLYFIKKAVPNL